MDITDEIKIIAIDDEESLLADIREYFQEYNIVTYADPQEALLELNRNFYDIVIVDYKMPKLTGVDLLIEARKNNAYYYGILFTAYADKQLLENAINKNIISSFIEKPLKLKFLKQTIEQAVLQCRQKQEEDLKITRYNEYLKEHSLLVSNIVGLQGGLKNVFTQVQSLARHNATVMLLGETGTGKEVIARLIHELSNRHEHRMIEVNCAAIPDNLLESELFGHIKGAFTGAANDKPGKIELADKGTLFLDEIGEMKLDLQVKLLRVLQDKKIERVGCNKSRDIDFRLIVATNKNLEQAIREQTFREDLFYRINTLPVQLPALRERTEDIKDMIRFYLDKYCKEMKIKTPLIEDNAYEVLKKYNWPGNIRELTNAVQRVLIYSSGKDILTVKDFSFLFINPENSSNLSHAISTLKEHIISKELNLKDVEYLILNAIKEHYDNKISKAVEATGIPKDKFYRIDKKDNEK